MSLQAKIVYDYEIEELKRDGGLTIIPLIGYLFENHPDADPAVLLYTAQEHVLTYGMNSDYPKELVIPPGYVAEEIEDVEVIADHDIEPEIEEVVPSKGNSDKPLVVSPPRRVLKTQTKVSKNPNNVNYRSIMDDIDRIGLS